MQRMFRRATSQRENLAVVEYKLVVGGSRGMMQPRIDTGSWTHKGKNAKGSSWQSMVKVFPYCWSIWKTGWQSILCQRGQGDTEVG
jgi:hypothetical protein